MLDKYIVGTESGLCKPLMHNREQHGIDVYSASVLSPEAL